MRQVFPRIGQVLRSWDAALGSGLRKAAPRAREASRVAWGAIRGRRWALASVFVVAFLFVGYGTSRFMEKPTFCGLCHSMQPYVKLYLRSGHGTAGLDFQCMECHGETRLAGIRNKYLGVLYSHFTDGPAGVIALFQGRSPEAQFDPDYPVVPSERCLRCHNPGSKARNAFPVTAERHSKPIDVSREFRWVLENPRGKKYQCKVCHADITHPTGGKVLPLRKGKEQPHPYLKAPLDVVTQIHVRALDQAILRVADRMLEFDRETCRRCHRGELASERGRPLCQGCHTKAHRVEAPKNRLVPLSATIPNLNDYYGAKGEVRRRP